MATHAEATARGRMQAVIAGSLWRATYVAVRRSDGLIALFGAGDDAVSVALAVPLDHAVGIHPTATTPANAVLVIDDVAFTTNAACDHGAITVHRLTDRRLAGSFSLVAGGRGAVGSLRIHVTGGRFDVFL